MAQQSTKPTFGTGHIHKTAKTVKYMITPGLLSLLFLLCATVSAHELTEKKETPSSSQRQAFLKFNLQPGSKYLFSSTITQNIDQEMMGQKMTTTQAIVSDYLYDIKSVEKGITTVQVTFKTIKLDMDIAGMQRISYDSGNPDGAADELKALSNMVGRSFTMQIDATGTIGKIEGLSELIASAGGQQAEMLKQTFGDSSMIHNMNQITNIYPNKNTAIGVKWDKKSSGQIAGIMQTESNSTFSLTDIEGDLAILENEGQLKFSKIEGPGANPMLQGAEFNLSGTQTGTLEIEIKSGLPILTKLQQHISGNIDVQGFQIPMTIVSDMVITGKKL